MRVADYIIKRLAEEINHLFLVTGRGILYLSDAAAKNPDMNCICVHHEQAGGYAAMAYAQDNGKLGACLVSSGCAATNVITPVLCAFQDEVPLVIVSGQNKANETVYQTKLPIRTFGQQETNIVEIVKPITKYAVTITNPEKIAVEMDKALYYAKEARKGPVWIDVPLDIQNARIDEENLERFIPDENKQTLLKEDIDKIAEALNEAMRPLILFGSAIKSANCQSLLKEFIEKFKYPVVYTNSAVDVYNTSNPLSMGAIGTMAANRAANFAVQNCDFLLVLGNRLTSMSTGNDAFKFAREAKIFSVDVDVNEHKKGNVKVDKAFIGDVKDFLLQIQKKELRETDKFWQDKCIEWKKVFPKFENISKGNQDKVDLYSLANTLSKLMNKDDILITDAGLEELILPSNVTFRDNQKCLHPVNQGAMGYALPASIGAFYSSNKNVIAVIGDGSFMMNLQELQTISYNKLPLKILIINNDCYAVIRKRQQDLFRTRTIGTDASNGLSCPDFKQIAQCFNINYISISIEAELEEKLQNMFRLNCAIICEIMGKPNQNYIHSSYRRSENGKFVQPPIEDQSPFLDRELFKNQMIIDPIDL